MDIVKLIKEVKKWQVRQGKKEYLQFLEGGKPISPRQAIIAKCYECNCGYDDGTGDCKILTCPLHAFMPFKEGGPQKTKTISEEQKRLMKEGRLSKR